MQLKYFICFVIIINKSILSIKIIFFLSLASLALLSIFTYRQNVKLINRAMMVNHTNLIKLELGNHLSFLKDAETGRRGFLLVNDSGYLEPYNTALLNIPTSLKILDSLLKNNPQQISALQKLKELSEKRLLIFLEFKTKKLGDEGLIKLMQKGKSQMDALRKQTAVMIYEEERLLNLRTEKLKFSASFTPILSLIVAGFTIFLLVFSYLKILWELKRVNILQKRLTVSNDVLENSNIELAQFAYIASHDLQEPLRKIQTFISRINEDEKNLTLKGKDYFERINKSARRMQQLILDILSYSRLNKNENAKEKSELLKIVEVAKYSFEEYLHEKNATVITKKLPVVNVVIYQFEQLFTNLISNAIKFAKANEKSVITISAKTIDGKGINLKGINVNIFYHCIIIADNGIGFEPQHQEKIFNIFNRLNTKEEYEGNGIGLSIVKKIMDAHSGFVTATGEKGVGATFILYLPA